MTAFPLGIAFLIGRRAANRRHTYGYGLAENLAGIVIVHTIAASVVVAGSEAIRRLTCTRIWTGAVLPVSRPTAWLYRCTKAFPHPWDTIHPLRHATQPQHAFGRLAIRSGY